MFQIFAYLSNLFGMIAVTRLTDSENLALGTVWKRV